MTEGEGPNLLGWTVQGSDAGGKPGTILTLAVHPDNPDRLFVGGINLWESEDGGQSWNCSTLVFWRRPPLPARRPTRHPLSPGRYPARGQRWRAPFTLIPTQTVAGLQCRTGHCPDLSGGCGSPRHGPVHRGHPGQWHLSSSTTDNGNMSSAAMASTVHSTVNCPTSSTLRCTTDSFPF